MEAYSGVSVPHGRGIDDEVLLLFAAPTWHGRVLVLIRAGIGEVHAAWQRRRTLV